MTKSTELENALALLRQQRWAALASVDAEGQPQASMVAYALAPERAELYLHLSRLAAHTANLLAKPACSVVISERDAGQGDPQQLARLSLFGQVAILERGSDEYIEGRHYYLQRLPDAEPLFDFPDFILFRMRVAQARFVGGFARAYSYSADELHRAVAR